MAIIVRRHTRVIVRRKKPDPPPSRTLGGWIYRDGYPPNPSSKTFHCLEIDGERHVFLWVPRDEMWSAGLHRFTAGVAASRAAYVAPCSVVLWEWKEPKPDNYYRRRK